jgi:hypothetical protein
LWVLASIVYSIPVAVVAFLDLQSAGEKTYYNHTDSFYEKLRPASLAALAVSRTQSGGSIWFVNPDDVDTQVEMPNGHALPFRKGVAKEQMRAVGEEYLVIAERSKPDRRASIISYALLAWIGPCIALYFLGWGIGWVYRGFKKQ